MLDQDSRRALEARHYPELRQTVFGCIQAQLAARLRPNALVLDVGSGPGSWIMRAQRKRLRFRLVGVDVYKPDISQLDAFLLARAEQLPFAEHSFDLVVAHNVIEHLPDPPAVFAECARILRRGGYFLIKTPAANTPLFMLSRLLPTSLHHKLKAGAWSAEESVFPTYYGANTLGGLERHLAQAGFQRDWLYTVDQTYAYLAHARWTYALGLRYSRLTQRPALAWLRNQIVGIYHLPEEAR